MSWANFPPPSGRQHCLFILHCNSPMRVKMLRMTARMGAFRGLKAPAPCAEGKAPKGLKPSHFWAVCGTTEVVPLLQGESAFRGLKAPAPRCAERPVGARAQKGKARTWHPGLLLLPRFHEADQPWPPPPGPRPPPPGPPGRRRRRRRLLLFAGGRPPPDG